MEDIINIHIWQLPIKNNNIDKQNDYTIIHSINTKKIKMQKLYEYFNQDSKIELVSENIQSILNDKDEEYDLIYKTLQLSLNEYESKISELQDKFTINRNNIRDLESISSYIDINNNNVITTLEDADNKYYNIFVSFNDFYDICNSIEDLIDNNKDTIKSFENTLSKLETRLDSLISNSKNMSTQIKNIQNELDLHNEDKNKMLLENIQYEYDRIISIIDHYHHIHI